MMKKYTLEYIPEGDRKQTCKMYTEVKFNHRIGSVTEIVVMPEIYLLFARNHQCDNHMSKHKTGQ